MSQPDIKSILALDEFQAHWNHVATPIDILLTNHLIDTCQGLKGGDNAQAEAGSVKELAHIIKLFRTIKHTAAEAPKNTAMKPLHRHIRKDPTKPDAPKP